MQCLWSTIWLCAEGMGAGSWALPGRCAASTAGLCPGCAAPPLPPAHVGLLCLHHWECCVRIQSTRLACMQCRCPGGCGGMHDQACATLSLPASSHSGAQPTSASLQTCPTDSTLRQPPVRGLSHAHGPQRLPARAAGPPLLRLVGCACGRVRRSPPTHNTTRHLTLSCYHTRKKCALTTSSRGPP